MPLDAKTIGPAGSIARSSLSFFGFVIALIATPLQAANHEESNDILQDAVIPEGIDESSQSSSIPAPQNTDWEVSVTPYIWFAGLSGDVGVKNLQPVAVDASFGDIFDNLQMAAMVMVDARRDRLVLLADFAYLDLGIEKDVGVRDPLYGEAKLGMSSVMTTMQAGYRAIDKGPLYVDMFGGLRLTSLTTNIELVGPARSASGSGSRTWVDPVIGLRTSIPLGEKWSLNGYGDVGGFGFSSDITWQLLGTVDHRLSSHWNMSVGWRYFAIDYRNSGFVYDVAMSGPIATVSYRF